MATTEIRTMNADAELDIPTLLENPVLQGYVEALGRAGYWLDQPPTLLSAHDRAVAFSADDPETKQPLRYICHAEVRVCNGLHVVVALAPSSAKDGLVLVPATHKRAVPPAPNFLSGGKVISDREKTWVTDQIEQPASMTFNIDERSLPDPAELWFWEFLGYLAVRGVIDEERLTALWLEAYEPIAGTLGLIDRLAGRRLRVALPVGQHPGSGRLPGSDLPVSAPVRRRLLLPRRGRPEARSQDLRAPPRESSPPCHSLHLNR